MSIDIVRRRLNSELELGSLLGLSARVLGSEWVLPDGTWPSESHPLGLTSLGASSIRRIISGLSFGGTPPEGFVSSLGILSSSMTVNFLPVKNARKRLGHGSFSFAASTIMLAAFFAAAASSILWNFFAKKYLQKEKHKG